MAILLKRQLNDDEKALIVKQHGRKCFATGHEIPNGEEMQFDHIHAFSKDGPSELNNIAPMCAKHNKEKGALSLGDFRVKLRLGEFFKKGDKLTLKDLLQHLKEEGDIEDYAQPVSIKENSNSISLESHSQKIENKFHICPITSCKYFYATINVELLDSDDDENPEMGLQPRYLIFDKVFNLYRHFQQHPVLQPSIGRIFENRIRLFDGQHKIAALLWNGRKDFECKIYITPDIRLLNETNMLAHDKYSQTRFYSSIMILKLGSQFGADFENYRNLENGQPKTEVGFMDYLNNLDNSSLTRGDLNKRFRSYLYSSVLEHKDNKLKRLISSSNRSSNETPLTMDMLEKSLFSNFLYRIPTEDNMTPDSYKRDYETNNMVAILNMLGELALNAWDSKASPNDLTQIKLNRIFRSKSMMAWAEILRDAVCGKLELQDAEDRERPLYRQLDDQQLAQIRKVISRLINWKRWDSPGNDEIERVLADNKSAVKEWFKSNGLTTGYLMGAAE